MNKPSPKKKLLKDTPADYMTTKKHGVVMQSDFQRLVDRMLKTPPLPKGKEN
jgi:hypothetical protein